MLTDDLRLIVFSTVISEFYRKCGLTPSTKNNTSAKVLETPFGTSIYGYEFNLVLNSKRNENGINEIVVCDICFSTPTNEIIDDFAKKLYSLKNISDINIIGIVVFTESLPVSVAKYACDLSVYTLTYQAHPVIKPIINELNILCNDYVYKDLLNDDPIQLKHEIAGYLQNYTPLNYLQTKPYFVNGFQIGFMNIKNKCDINMLGLFAVTPSGYLMHLVGSDAITISRTCKITCRTKDSHRYKSLSFKGCSGRLCFCLPTAISNTTLFGDEKQLTFNTFEHIRAKTFKVSVE